MASSRMGSGNPNPPPANRSPRLAAVVRGVAPRKSVISRLTQFSRPPVSVVPYAPERLSITQTAMTPEMMKSIADKGAQRDQAIKSRKEDSVTTLFAALRMRRVLHRVQAEQELSGPRIIVDETKANLERHLKVLSRYKIRQVDTDADERLQLRNLPPFMVNPHSTWYKVWQLVTLVIIIYQSIMLPFALAFGSNDTTVVDILMSSIFAMDIAVAFNTPVAEDSDETAYILNRWHIASNYLRGWFFFDLLACMPFDYVLLLVNNSKGNLSVLGLLKALRVPRLLRLVRLLRVAKLFKMRPELRRWLQYSRHANLLRLVSLVVCFLVINHYVACFWFGVVMSEQTRALDPSADSAHLYVVAFYQSLLVVMGQNITVYEDTEYIFCVLAMVVGAVLMAVVFGNVAILIANYYESQSSHQKKMEWLFASMNRMKLPYDLQNRINAYYQAMWERHGTLDGAVTAFIPELSRNLGYEVELFLRMDMINRAPIFQNCSAKVVQELVMELELQVFMPGDYVVVRGEVGNDMYFVQNGICEVTKEVDIPPVPVPRNPSRLSQASQAAQAALHRKGSSFNRESISAQNPPPPPIMKSKEVVLKVLGQGDYFGEIALLMNCKRTANVRAQVFSELCTLTREAFESISQRYLEDRSIIEKFIMDKYDPSMLQAAMKQSQEVSMRSSGPAAAVAAAATRTGNGLFKSSQPGPSGSSHAMSFGEATSRAETATAKITGLLTKVLQRIDHLEEQLGKEAAARRESETRLRHTLTEATKRMSINSRSPASSLVDQVPKHPGALKRYSAKAVADEPERVSQRNLLAEQLAELEAKEARTASIDEPTELSAKVAPSDSPDDSKGIRRRPSLKALRSWRNLRNEGLLGMRLRTSGSRGPRLSQAGYTPGIGAGVGAVGAGGSFRRSSSRSNSRHSSAARANDSYIDPKLLKPEPDVRSDRESDDENADQFPSDLLDDLARSLDPQQPSGSRFRLHPAAAIRLFKNGGLRPGLTLNLGRTTPLDTVMMRMGDPTVQPTPPAPPEIEGFLKKLKRKTRSLAGNWNKRWFFVDPRRREFGYSDNRTSAPRSSIYLDDITAVVQFDDTHFQVESRTRNFFLCGESKASTACWVSSLEGYRKKLIEYEKEKIAYAAYAASAAAKASAATVERGLENPQQSPPAAARQVANRKKKSRDCSDDDDCQPTHPSSSSSMSSTSSSSRTKRDKATDRLPPKSEQRSASPFPKDRNSSRSKNDRHRERERGRDRDRKFEREHKREPSNDRDRTSEREKSDRDRSSEREKPGQSDRDRSRDRNAPAPSGRGSVMQAWVDDF